MTSPALASAICSGDSPRATSDLIRPIMRSNSASSRSTPILDSRSSASASACALARPPRHGAVARHLVGDRPSSLAICLQDLRLSRPLSIAARSALSSLRYGLVAFFPMSFLSLGRAFGPRFKKGFSDSAGHVPLSPRTKVKCSGELAN